MLDKVLRGATFSGIFNIRLTSSDIMGYEEVYCSQCPAFLYSLMILSGIPDRGNSIVDYNTF